MSELKLEWSINGTDFTIIQIPAQPTGSGTAVWRLISGLTLPADADNKPNLRLKWTNTSSGGPQFRIDDIKLISAAPLPVELTRFEARPEAEGVALRWETASELNNELFEVQHSADGRQFRVLDEVPGAGTTLLAMQYDYLHQAPLTGSNYYRLRQVDYDGRYDFSPVRVVEWGGAAGSAGDWSLRPTVTSDLIHLIRREVRGEGRWSIIGPSGRLVREGSIGADTDMLPIDVASLPPGIWLLQVRTRQGVWTERFQKI